jgi:hypothetical protein
MSRSQWEAMGKKAGWDKLAVGRNIAPPILEYLHKVDALLKSQYGINSSDTNTALIDSCRKNGETPEECVNRIGEKYDLATIGSSISKQTKQAGPHDPTSGYSGKDLYHEIQNRSRPLPQSSGMMPGQTPYTEEELKAVRKLVSDAALGDPGEQGESAVLKEADEVSKRRPVRVTFNDGDIVTTEINGTRKEIEDYYLKHNFVKEDETTMHHGVKVEFLD